MTAVRSHPRGTKMKGSPGVNHRLRLAAPYLRWIVARGTGYRLLSPALLASLMLGGCATSTHLGRSELSRVAGRTYVVVGASSHGASAPSS